MDYDTHSAAHESRPGGTEARPIFDAIAASRGTVRGPFSVLMHSPEVAGRTAHLGTFVRSESSLAPDIREITVMTAARECECAYEWAAHVVSAREAGFSDATIEVIKQRLPVDSLPPREQALVRYARETVRDHKVSDNTFEAVHGLLDDRGMAELTVAVGYYCLLACVLNAFEVPPLPGGEVLPQVN